DYHAINKELVRHLDRGCRSIRLSGAGGQRLLVSGLVGPWSAVIAVDGDAGPELAAGLDAPAVTVVGRGSAADGGARGVGGRWRAGAGEGGPGLRLRSAGWAGGGHRDRRPPDRSRSTRRRPRPDRTGRSPGRGAPGGRTAHHDG